MNRIAIVALSLLALAGVLVAEEAMKDAEMGLSKESVFETPSPIIPVDAGGEPGENPLLQAYFAEGIPPMIPHSIEDLVPITMAENLCMDCHALPEEIGEYTEEGDPTPIPATHYTDLRADPIVVSDEVIGARWVCVQCHASQMVAEPLVENTYLP